MFGKLIVMPKVHRFMQRNDLSKKCFNKTGRLNPEVNIDQFRVL